MTRTRTAIDALHRVQQLVADLRQVGDLKESTERREMRAARVNQIRRDMRHVLVSRFLSQVDLREVDTMLEDEIGKAQARAAAFDVIDVEGADALLPSSGGAASGGSGGSGHSDTTARAAVKQVAAETFLAEVRTQLDEIYERHSQEILRDRLIPMVGEIAAADRRRRTRVDRDEEDADRMLRQYLRLNKPGLESASDVYSTATGNEIRGRYA